jgi:uncharacterized cupin superfamily protein
MTAVAHWDEVEPYRRESGHIGGSWRDLGTAAGSVRTGVKRIDLDQGKWSTPAHEETSEEEIFYVLRGSGISWQDGEVYAVREGDCLVHLMLEGTHTLRAGDDGLDVLAFGERAPGPGARLPRAGVNWLGNTWVELPGDPHPFAREAAVGAPEVGERSERPPSIANVADVAGNPFGQGGTVQSVQHDLGDAAGSERTGLNYNTVSPGKLLAPPHVHSAEEEIFIVLEGDGELQLGDERYPIRPGSVVARPAGTRVSHALLAGDGGLTVLGYGTREPNDIAYYPRSGKFSLRGVGVMGRIEQLDYWDGES